jgi:hypothetical protein
MIPQLVISDPVTWIGSNRFALPWAALCSKVLHLLQTEAQPIAAAEAADTASIQEPAGLRPKTRWNLQVVLPCNEKGGLPLADGARLSTPAIRRQFLGELLRDCGFFAHLVFRQVRTVRNPSSRLFDRDSPRTKLNVVKGSQTPPRSSSDGEASSLQPEAPSSFLQTLWVEVGCRQVQTHVSEKECHEYGKDSKPAL